MAQTPTLNQIKAAKSGLTHYFPFEAGETPNNVFVNDTWSDLDGIYKWRGRDDYFTTLSGITGIQNLKEIKKATFILDQLEKDLSTTTTTEIPKYEAQTTTTGLDLDIKVEDAASRRQKSEAIRARQKETVAKFREAGEKRYQNQQKKDTQKVKSSDELINQFFGKIDKKVVVAPTEAFSTVTFNKSEQQTIVDLSRAAKANPSVFEQEMEVRIKKSLDQASDEYKEAVTSDVIKQNAQSITNSFVDLPNYTNATEVPVKVNIMHRASPFAALTLLEDAKLKGLLTDEEVRRKFVEVTQALALGLDAENRINFAGAKAALGSSNIAQALYGPEDGHITQFGITENSSEQQDGGVEFNLGEIYKFSKKFYEFHQKIQKARMAKEVLTTPVTYTPIYTGTAIGTAEKISKALPAAGAIYGFREGTLLAHWAKYNMPLLAGGKNIAWLTAGGVQNTVLASGGISSRILFDKNLGMFSFRAMEFTKGSKVLYTAGGTFGEKAFGLYLGQAGGKVGAGTIAVKAGGQVITKAVPSAVASKIGAFLGAAGGWVGIIIGFLGGELLGKLIEKINWAKVKKWFEENKFMFALGATLSTAVLFGPVGGLLAGGLVLGATGSLGIAAAGAFALFGIIGKSVGATLAKSVIIILIILPPLVALILLVINNSAYVVPRGDQYGGFDPTTANAFCSDISGTLYCFPVAPLDGTEFGCSHHDYPASDIFRAGDLPGKGDDKPMTIVAYIGGRVTWTSENNSLGGHALIIAGNDGRYYYYSHNERNLVTTNQTVSTGQPIAIMDSTGNAEGTQEHLHFGISRDDDFRTLLCTSGATGGCVTQSEWNRITSFFVPSVTPGGGGDFKDKLDITCPYP